MMEVITTMILCKDKPVRVDPPVTPEGISYLNRNPTLFLIIAVTVKCVFQIMHITEIWCNWWTNSYLKGPLRHLHQGWSRRTTMRGLQWAVWGHTHPSCRSQPVASGWRWPPRKCSSLHKGGKHTQMSTAKLISKCKKMKKIKNWIHKVIWFHFKALASERFTSQVQGLRKLFGGWPRMAVCVCVPSCAFYRKQRAIADVNHFAHSKKKSSDMLISVPRSTIFRRSLTVRDDTFSFVKAAFWNNGTVSPGMSAAVSYFSSLPLIGRSKGMVEWAK